MQTVITQYKDLTRWDVKFFASEFLFGDDLVELREFLIPRNEKIKKDNYSGELDIVEKVKFNNGQIYFRDERNTGMDLFRGYKGDLLTSKINIHQGAVAICPQDLVCSTHYYLYQINDKKIIPEYLILALRSNSFLQKILQLKASSIKNEIGPKVFLDFKIYAPDIKEQRRIVEFWHKAKKHAEDLNKKADEQEKEIDDYILRELGIEKKEYKKKKGAFVAKYKNLGRWGIEFNSYEWTLDDLLLSKIFPSDQIKNIAKINQTYQFSKDDLKKEVSFIPMESVSDIEGRIIATENIILDKIKNGYTRFAEGDIIFAKITPCMENGKCAIAKNLTNEIGIGSTEFHVVSPNGDLIDTKYLWNILRTKIFRKSAERFFTGSAGQKRVPVNFLEDIKIPLPPLPIQKKVAGKMEKMRAEIQEMKNTADETLEQAKNKIGEMLKV